MRVQALRTPLAALEQHASKYHMLALTRPINHDAERNAWIKSARNGVFGNPSFVYDEEYLQNAISESGMLREASIQLYDLFDPGSKAEERVIYEMAEKAIGKQLAICDIASAMLRKDDTANAIANTRYFGPLHNHLVNYAYQIDAGNRGDLLANYLDNIEYSVSRVDTERLQKTTVSTAELASYLREAVDVYKFPRWTVDVSPAYSSVTVTALTPEPHIFVPESYKPCNLVMVATLIGHEIEQHVSDYANCIHALEQFGLPFELARVLVARQDSTLTEGYAKCSDARVQKIYTGTSAGAPHPYYVIAIDLAQKGYSFAQISEDIFTRRVLQGYDSHDAIDFAWKITYRVLRGCADTKNPHNFARTGDRSYLEGFIRAIKLGESGIGNFAKFSENHFALLKAAGLIAAYPHQYIAERMFLQ